MNELMFTRQEIEPDGLAAIESAVSAAYAGYGGMIYSGERRLLRLLFVTAPTEEERIEIGALVNRAPVFSRRVTGLFERRPQWR